MAQTATRFVFSEIAAEAAAGAAFPVSVRLTAADGTVVSNDLPSVNMTSFQPVAALPVISEIDRAGEVVEITNPAIDPADIGNWEVQILPDYGYFRFEPNARLRIPVGTTLAPGVVMTWAGRGEVPGAFPAFVGPERFNTPRGFHVVRLLNAVGEVVDEVYFGDSAQAPVGAFWRGPALGNIPSNTTYSRLGSANHAGTFNWGSAAPSLGLPNAAISLPWTNVGRWLIAEPHTVSVSNGTWAGTVSIPSASPGEAWLYADDGRGLSGRSSPFRILPLPAINLTVPTELLSASEGQPGAVALVTLSIPSIATTNTWVDLEVSDTNEFQIPSRVVIQTGATSVQFAVTNLDDPLADGTALVELSARSPGYSSGRSSMLNADDEDGGLFVLVQGPLRENSGFAKEPGVVFLKEPARHDVVVSLEAESPVEVPQTVIVRKGRVSQTFAVRVGGDAVVNPFPWAVKVRANTAQWPSAETEVELVNDDDSGFQVVMPSAVVEGLPQFGRILVNTAHAADTVFSLSVEHSRLVVPSHVSVPAGSLSVEFPMSVPDDREINYPNGARVCVGTEGQSPFCRDIILVDDEVDIHQLQIVGSPAAIFSGQPFVLTATLANVFGAAQKTNGIGQIELMGATGAARLEPEIPFLDFVDGSATNSITLEGEALDTRIKVSAAGFQTESPAIDILSGREIAASISDAVWSRASGKILVAETAQTNQPARLVELDPHTGIRGRSLNLPMPVRRIALSDDGQVAWLAFMHGSLQRVNLRTWELDGTFPMEVGTTNAEARHIVVLPNQRDLVVAVANVKATGWKLVVYDHGLASSNRASLTGVFVADALASGRNAGEVFFQSAGTLRRFLVDSKGVTLDRSVNVGSVSGAAAPSLTLVDGLLYRGTGQVFLPETLEQLPRFATQSSALGVPFHDQSTAVFLEQNNVLRSYDMVARQTLGSHSLPGSSGELQRLFRWGDRGLAAFGNAGTKLLLFETPLISKQRPDLVLSAIAPATVAGDSGAVGLASFTWEFGITNRGTVAAPAVELSLETGEFYQLGTLAPGEGSSIRLPYGSYEAKIFRAVASIKSGLVDAEPTNNVLEVVTRVERPPVPNSRQMILGMTHLIASPVGDRLYAAISRSAGDVEDGVAVVNPATGELEEVLNVGTDPRRLAVSDDGSRLFVLLGTNSIVRWNLLASSNEMSLGFTGERVLDLAVVPGSSTSLVVATTSRVVVFDDDRPRGGSFSNAVDRCHLGFAEDVLWTAEPGMLRPFAIGLEGLVPGTPTSFSLFADFYQFASDGQRLFFSGTVFDTESRERNNRFLGDSFCVDTGSGMLFSPVGNALRSYSLDDLSLIQEQTLPQATVPWIQDPVRWGADGLAVRAGNLQLIMVRSPLVPSAVASDLVVTIVPPENPRPLAALQWQITVTNKSPLPAPRSVLSINGDDLLNLSVQGPLPVISGPALNLLVELGDVPGHSAMVFSVHGATWGRHTMSASVITAAQDPVPSDNSASVSIIPNYPNADLSIHSVSVQSGLAVGAEFAATFVFTNAGPEAVDTTLLQLVRHPAADFIGVVGDAYPTNEYGPLLGSLAPLGSKTVTLRFMAKQPGLVPLSAWAFGEVNDPANENNHAGGFAYVEPSTNNQPITGLAFPKKAIMAWDTTRQQILAAFPDDAWSLVVLHPASLAPLFEVPLGGLPEFVVSCQNGRHAWVSLAGGEAVRVDLETRAIDLRFRYDPRQAPVWAVAAPPGQSNILLVAMDPGFSGNNHVRVFDNGVARSNTFDSLGWTGGGVALHFTPEGRLFVASSKLLRELTVAPSGLQQIQSLDPLGSYSGNSLSSVSNRLFYGQGRVVDLGPETATEPLGAVAQLIADPEIEAVYLIRRSPDRDQSLELRLLDPRSLDTIWRLSEPPTSPPFSLYGIVPMGTNGVLLLGDEVRLVKPALLGIPQTQLGLALTTPSVVGGAEISFPISISVSNRAAWAPGGATLEIDLATGLRFAVGSPAAGNSHLTVDLGSFDGGTNLSFSIVASAPGDHAISASISGLLHDSDNGDNSASRVVSILPPPVLLFDDSTVNEGNMGSQSELIAWLSRPATTSFAVPFSIVPLTATADDFYALTGSFQFYEGSIRSSAFVIRADFVPEADETAVLTISSDLVSAVKPSAVLRIVNDDLPVVSISNVSVNEGASGVSSAGFRVVLDQPAPFASEVRFTTVPVTAIPGLDYIAREGWVRFSAGETVATVNIPVMGDTLFEPAETTSFVLTDTVDAMIGTSSARLTILNDDPPDVPQPNWVRFDSGLRFDFPTQAGATYRLQVRTNLTLDSWKTLPGVVVGEGLPASLLVPQLMGNQGYYRVVAQ